MHTNSRIRKRGRGGGGRVFKKLCPQLCPFFCYSPFLNFSLGVAHHLTIYVMTSQENLQITYFGKFCKLDEKKYLIQNKTFSKEGSSWSNNLRFFWGCFIKQTAELYRLVTYEKSEPCNLKMTFLATSPN